MKSIEQVFVILVKTVGLALLVLLAFAWIAAGHHKDVARCEAKGGHFNGGGFGLCVCDDGSHADQSCGKRAL